MQSRAVHAGWQYLPLQDKAALCKDAPFHVSAGGRQAGAYAPGLRCSICYRPALVSSNKKNVQLDLCLEKHSTRFICWNIYAVLAVRFLFFFIQ